MKGFRPGKQYVPVPPAFAAQREARNEAETLNRNAIDALLAHRATGTDMGRIEAMAEVAIRAIRKARKTPHCKHLDRDALDEAETVMLRAGRAILRAKDRQCPTGVFGLDSGDRKAIEAMDAWHGAMSRQGEIPRSIWLWAAQEAQEGRGRVLIPREVTQ